MPLFYFFSLEFSLKQQCLLTCSEHSSHSWLLSCVELRVFTWGSLLVLYCIDNTYAVSFILPFIVNHDIHVEFHLESFCTLQHCIYSIYCFWSPRTVPDHSLYNHRNWWKLWEPLHHIAHRMMFWMYSCNVFFVVNSRVFLSWHRCTTLSPLARVAIVTLVSPWDLHPRWFQRVNEAEWSSELWFFSVHQHLVRAW